MKTRLAVVAVLLSAGSAAAQPFARATSFQECTKSTAFACNMRDASGMTYGTAKEITHCTTWTFRPDGTFTTSWADHGVYRVAGGKVTITQIDDSGKRAASYDLVLSPDGSKLGGMIKL
jgi:hypothetical protein